MGIKLTPQEISEIINLYITKKESIIDISKKFLINRKTTTKILNKNNIELRKPKECHNNQKLKYDEDKAINLYLNEKKSIRTIAKELSATYGVVRILLKNKKHLREIAHKNKIISKEDACKIIKLHENNIPTNDIANQLRVSQYAVVYTLNKNGIKPKKLISNTKVPSNFTFLDFTPEKCFVLGLIFGDGHVDKTHITIYSSLQDIDNLEKVNKLFGGELKIRRDERSENAISINICSKRLCNELRDEFGLVSNKSDKIIFPRLPKNMIPFFISGFLAADGSSQIYRYKYLEFHLTFASTSLSFVNSIRDIVDYKTKIYKRLPIGISKKPLYTLRYSNKVAIKACDYIYEGSIEETRCNRKYNNYIDFKGYIHFKSLIS